MIRSALSLFSATALRSSILILCCLAQVLYSPGSAFAEVQQTVRQRIDAQIEALSDRESSVREKAAETIRNLLAKEGGSVPGDKDQSYWEKQLQAIKVGMTKDEVERLLPSEGGTQPTLGQGMGSYSVVQRLDRNWEATLYYDPSNKIYSLPKLSASTLSVWVPPSDTYTGKWTTYFVNGQKSQEIEYKNGEYDGIFISYYSNGSRSYQQHYVNGIINGLDEGWHSNGAKSYSGNYKNDRKDGVWIWWNEDGSKNKEVLYKDGKAQ